MVDRVTSDFLNCKVDANLTKEEQKKVVQSVELTKALVLMGYNMWSELEPASERENEGYVERKLQARMDEKINGLADFKQSADFARTLNATLQEKMMEANEERAQALFSKDKVSAIVQEIAEDEEGKDDRAKNQASIIDKLDEEMLREEAAQMEKAIKVLMNEYQNRKKVRERTKRAAGQVTKRVAAMMIFNKKKDTFSKIKQTQLDEIQAYQKKKEEYHKQQEELAKKKAKEDELAKEKELEERKKRESSSGLSMGQYGRDNLDSTNSDEGSIFGGPTRGGRGRRNNNFDDFDEDEDVFGGPTRKDSVKGGPKTRGSLNSTGDDHALQRKDSEKEKPKKGKKIYKERGPDMSRTAKTIQGVFYWDRQQNQKTNTTFGRSKGTLDTGNVKKKKGKKKDDEDDGSEGALKVKKSPASRRAASPMLGRKTPQVDRKQGSKTPAALKKKDFLVLPSGDTDSEEEDYSTMGSGMGGMKKSKSHNTLGGVSLASTAFRATGKRVNF